MPLIGEYAEAYGKARLTAAGDVSDGSIRFGIQGGPSSVDLHPAEAGSLCRDLGNHLGLFVLSEEARDVVAGNTERFKQQAQDAQARVAELEEELRSEVRKRDRLRGQLDELQGQLDELRRLDPAEVRRVEAYRRARELTRSTGFAGAFGAAPAVADTITLAEWLTAAPPVKVEPVEVEPVDPESVPIQMLSAPDCDGDCVSVRRHAAAYAAVVNVVDVEGVVQLGSAYLSADDAVQLGQYLIACAELHRAEQTEQATTP